MGLFSSVYHTHSTKEVAVPYEKTVIEKRAPTDDSIRLAGEYTEKTQKQFMSAFKLEPNELGEGINANVFAFCDERVGYATAHPSIKYFTKFKLNGKTFEFDFEMDPFEVMELRRIDSIEADKKIFQKVYKTISDTIALELIRSTGTKSIGLKEDYKF